MAPLLTLLIVVYALFESSKSLSTCEETDIVFIIDTDSIVNNGNTIIDFITSIIWSGSSEHSALSVVLYGEDIPNNQQTHVITLTDTHKIPQRERLERKTIDVLEKAFNKIDSYVERKQKKRNSKISKSVSLLDAFKIAKQENKPNHIHKAKRNLKYLDLSQPSKSSTKTAYFIFDAFDKLITERQNILCQLFNNIKNNKDESIHILLGHPYDSQPRVRCKRNIPVFPKHNLFYFFDKNHLMNRNNLNSLMEMIYDLTCPSTMLFPQLGGSVNLGNHNQYVDLKTVLKVYYLSMCGICL